MSAYTTNHVHSFVQKETQHFLLICCHGFQYLLLENGLQVLGALVALLEAGLQLVDSLTERQLLGLDYPDVYSAGDHIPEFDLRGLKTRYPGIEETPWIPGQLTRIKTGDMFRQNTPRLPDAI